MPMSNEEVEAYFEYLSLSTFARELIRSARNGAPARRVSPAGLLNTPCRYASTKMGWTISVESSEELTYAVICEFENDVLEYWDQPFRVQFPITATDGRVRRASYHPDFLVLRRNAVEFVQVKAQKAFEELPRINPNRWKVVNDQIQDLAADAYFQDMGLRHIIVFDGQINRTRADNGLLLLRAAEQPPAMNLDKLTQHVVAHLERETVSTLSELLEAIGARDSTAILQMVYAGVIAVDLDRCRLARADECPLALDHGTLQRFLATKTWSASNLQSWPHLSPREAIEAHSRLQAIRGEASSVTPPRTLRRWRHKFLQGEQDPCLLAPRTRSRGNRLRRLSMPEIAVIENAIDTYYMSPISPRAISCYRQYLLEVDLRIKNGTLLSSTRPVSFVTFLKCCRERDPEAIAKARGGSRLANAVRAPVSPELRSLKPLRPFQRAHIDHYPCDLHVVVAPELRKGRTKRPWLTLLRDEATGAVLAAALSFLSPSKRSCMAVLRDCVRRHQRVPETITVDGGKEFQSTYFELLLAHYRISKQSRPPGAPRFGGSVERAFGNLKEFLWGLPGGTSNDARGRGCSPKYRGHCLAKLDIHKTSSALDTYFFKHFNIFPVQNQLRSPQQQLNSGLEKFPSSGFVVEFNEAFLARTALPIGRLKIDPSRGVRHLGRWFHSTALARAKHRSVEAYEEPWDSSRLYVHVDGRLVACANGPMEPAPIYDVDRVLNSILALECADIRARLQRSKAKDMAAATRSANRDHGWRPSKLPTEVPRGLPPLNQSLQQLEVAREDDHG
jgi:putative transposase